MRAKVNQNINLEDYKGIYVIGEQIEGEIHPVTVELIGEAKNWHRIQGKAYSSDSRI